MFSAVVAVAAVVVVVAVSVRAILPGSDGTWMLITAARNKDLIHAGFVSACCMSEVHVVLRGRNVVASKPDYSATNMVEPIDLRDVSWCVKE